MCSLVVKGLTRSRCAGHLRTAVFWPEPPSACCASFPIGVGIYAASASGEIVSRVGSDLSLFELRRVPDQATSSFWTRRVSVAVASWFGGLSALLNGRRRAKRP